MGFMKYWNRLLDKPEVAPKKPKRKPHSRPGEQKKGQKAGSSAGPKKTAVRVPKVEDPVPALRVELQSELSRLIELKGLPMISYREGYDSKIKSGEKLVQEYRRRIGFAEADLKKARKYGRTFRNEIHNIESRIAISEKRISDFEKSAEDADRRDKTRLDQIVGQSSNFREAVDAVRGNLGKLENAAAQARTAKFEGDRKAPDAYDYPKPKQIDDPNATTGKVMIRRAVRLSKGAELPYENNRAMKAEDFIDEARETLCQYYMVVTESLRGNVDRLNAELVQIGSSNIAKDFEKAKGMIRRVEELGTAWRMLSSANFEAFDFEEAQNGARDILRKYYDKDHILKDYGLDGEAVQRIVQATYEAARPTLAKITGVPERIDYVLQDLEGLKREVRNFSVLASGSEGLTEASGYVTLKLKQHSELLEKQDTVRNKVNELYLAITGMGFVGDLDMVPSRDKYEQDLVKRIAAQTYSAQVRHAEFQAECEGINKWDREWTIPNYNLKNRTRSLEQGFISSAREQDDIVGRGVREGVAKYEREMNPVPEEPVIEPAPETPEHITDHLRPGEIEETQISNGVIRRREL